MNKYREMQMTALTALNTLRHLILLQKNINNLTLDYVRTHVPQLCESDYGLHRRVAIGQISESTERFKRSFYFNCLSE